MKVKKQNLENKIDLFIYNKLNETNYEIAKILPINLLTWNRIDLAFKLLYLKFKDKHPNLARKIYYNDIKAQTLGKFEEVGNEDKNSFQKYINDFSDIEISIKKEGFNEKESIIPLAKDGSIINGSHRVAAAIFNNKVVSTVNTGLKPFLANYENFYKKGVPIDIIEMVVKCFIEYSDNTYIAFLWPSGNKIEAENQFSNVLYKKEINFNMNGAYNLLFELYKHMDWIGTKENGYRGIKQKLTECFPVFRPFKVIAFQADNIDRVREIKQKVREIYKIGFSSIHITDTKEEAVRISKLIFNKNGLHFLNYSKPYKYINIYNELKKFENYLNENNISKKDVVIDSSIVMSLYGLRKNSDIDFLAYGKINKPNNNFEPHDSELIYHKIEKEELIYNPLYYFEFFDFKFISFNQLFSMKKNRNEQKDKNDIKIMKSLIENKKLSRIKAQLKQKYYYSSIKFKKNTKRNMINFLKLIKIFYPMRWIYRKIKH